MGEVRQAHMPGNYEQYDPATNRLGSVICKLCWENARHVNVGSLNTVWVSVDERPRIWWVCYQHMVDVRVGKVGSARFVKSLPQVISSPGI